MTRWHGSGLFVVGRNYDRVTHSDLNDNRARFGTHCGICQIPALTEGAADLAGRAGQAYREPGSAGDPGKRASFGLTQDEDELRQPLLLIDRLTRGRRELQRYQAEDATRGVSVAYV